MGETAALIGLGAAGLGSGLLSSASARSNNKDSIAFSRWSQLESQRYNQEMYEKQLADQERLYNTYQSPQAIAQALSEIGVNPASALSQVSGKGMPSVPSVSGSSPVGAPHLENEGLALGQGIQQMAGAVNAIAGAKMQDAQAKETRDMLQHKINGMLITQGLEQAQKDYQGLMNTLTEKYGDQKWSSEIQDLLSKAVLNVANGNLADAQSDYTKVLKMISDEDLGMKQEERAIFGTRLAIGIDNLKKQGLLLDEEKKTERSKQASNYASASYSNAMAETENVLRPYKKQIERANGYVAQASSREHIKQAENETKRQEWFNELLKNQNLGIVLQNKDKEVYNAFQRLVRGKSIDGDVSTVLRALDALEVASYAK